MWMRNGDFARDEKKKRDGSLVVMRKHHLSAN